MRLLLSLLCFSALAVVVAYTALVLHRGRSWKLEGEYTDQKGIPYGTLKDPRP